MESQRDWPRHEIGSRRVQVLSHSKFDDAALHTVGAIEMNARHHKPQEVKGALIVRVETRVQTRMRQACTGGHEMAVPPSFPLHAIHKTHATRKEPDWLSLRSGKANRKKPLVMKRTRPHCDVCCVEQQREGPGVSSRTRGVEPASALPGRASRSTDLVSNLYGYTVFARKSDEKSEVPSLCIFMIPPFNPHSHRKG